MQVKLKARKVSILLLVFSCIFKIFKEEKKCTV